MTPSIPLFLMRSKPNDAGGNDAPHAIRESNAPPGPEDLTVIDRLETRCRGTALIVFWALLFQILWLTYMPALGGPFIFDDYAGIVTNDDFHHGFEPWRLLSDHSTSLEFDRRPVTGLVTMIDQQLHGFNPTGYRVTNLLLHLFCAIALFSVLRRLAARFGCTAPRVLGITVSVVWLLHPLATSTVSYVYQRSEILMSLFYLAALICVLEARTSRRTTFWLSLSLVCVVLSTLSKEIGATLLVSIPLLERISLFSSFQSQWNQRKLFYGGLFLLTGAASAWILTGARMSELVAPDSPVGTPVAYFLAQSQALTRYLRLVFWPDPLIFFSAAPNALDITRSIACLAFLLLTFGSILWAGLKRPWLWLALGIFLAILAPTSSFIPIPLEPVAEFRMYLPMACVLTVVVSLLGGRIHSLLRGLSPSTQWLLCGGLVLLLAPMLISVSRSKNTVYSSPVSVWEQVLRHEPHNLKALANLGFRLIEAGDFRKAELCGRRVQQLGARYDSDDFVREGRRLVALTRIHQEDAEGAVEILNKLIGEWPEITRFKIDRAFALARLGRFEEAHDALPKRLSRADQNDPRVLTLRAEILIGLNRIKRARVLIDRLEQSFPNSARTDNLRDLIGRQ